MSGHKTKLTPKLIKAFCENISKGMPVKYSCAIVNISEAVYYLWRQKNDKLLKDLEKKIVLKKNLTVFQKNTIELFESFEGAKAKYIRFHLDNINEQSKKNMTGSQWSLSKFDRKHFGNVETVVNVTMPKLIEFEDE